LAKAKLTSKGQITIPKAVRDELGLRPGDEIEFVKDNGSFRLQRRVGPSPFHKWRGYLKELAGRSSDELVEELRGR
jgi:AbrB family looped-hinge helix DNA binding protein